MLNSFRRVLIARFRRARTRVSTLCALVVLVARRRLRARTRAGARAGPLDQDIKKLNQFVQTSDSPSIKIFREGRDLIENGQWAKAAEKFQGFVHTYPKDRDVDAALYWLAYAYKQQAMYREAGQQLGRLLKEHAESSWADEAEAMVVEIAPHLGQGGEVSVGVLRNNKKDEELKIVALQSLFEADRERAITYVTDWLKSGSAATKHMKEVAVSLLGEHGGTRAVPILLDIARNQPDDSLREIAIHRLGDIHDEAAVDGLMTLYAQERNAKLKVRILRSFADMNHPRAQGRLLEVAQSDPSPELRKTAIRWLADGLGHNAYEPLVKIYQTESDREIKVQVLRTLADMNDPRARQVLIEVARGTRGEDMELRQVAIRWLGDNSDDAVVDELMKIYESASSVDIKRQILRSFADMGGAPRARAKLLEAARGESNLELRMSAIRWLVDNGDAQTIEMLVGLYDGEQNPQIRASMLRTFGESQQKSGLRKLIDVARRDPSLELRKLAIRIIGESKDPEALKFLEEI